MVHDHLAEEFLISIALLIRQEVNRDVKATTDQGSGRAGAAGRSSRIVRRGGRLAGDAGDDAGARL